MQTPFHKILFMKYFFKNIKKIEFSEIFHNEESCLKFLANEKWEKGFVCRKCGHTNYCKGKKPYSRRCTKCKAEESATAHTVFHRCRIPLTDAFKITFMVCHSPVISTYEISRKIEIRQMTCWKFKKKIVECIDDRGDLDLLQKVELKQNLGV